MTWPIPIYTYYRRCDSELGRCLNTPHSDISVTTAAFATYPILQVIGVASRGPSSRAYRLRHMTITITKWFRNMGSCLGLLVSAHLGKCTESFISADHTW